VAKQERQIHCFQTSAEQEVASQEGEIAKDAQYKSFQGGQRTMSKHPNP